MKKIITALCAIMIMGILAGHAYAAAPGPNTNTVAYYTSGIHAIPLSPIIWLEGTDLVNKSGGSGSFQQWFFNDVIGYHSIWSVMHNDNSCPNGVVIADPYPEWGDYLTPNADYCVTTNTFTP